MIDLLILCLLFYESICDLKNLRVSVIPMALVSAVGIIINYVIYQRSILWFASGALVGLLVVAVGIITRQKIGYGDGILFVTLGLCLGMSASLIILLLSLVLVCVFGVARVIMGKITLKSALPFLPFVTVCFVMSLI